MKNFFSTKYSDSSISFSLLLLRLSVGGLMIPHGVDKLMHFSTVSPQFINLFHMGNAASLALNIFAELFCSGLIVLGLLTRLACIPAIISMAVAVFYAHHGDIFGDGQTATLYLVGYVALLFAGPGKISMDRLIGK